MKKETKPAINWGKVKDDYRAGVFSIREIGRMHALSDGAIRRKARIEGWTRDLAKSVNVQARRELVRTEVRGANAGLAVRTDREIIDVASVTIADVVRGHRRDISRGLALVDMLMHQLTTLTCERDDIERLIELETSEDKTAERRTKLLKAVSIPINASTLRDLSTAMKNLITLERQAFNIANMESETADPLKELLAHIAAHGQKLPIRK